MRRSARGTMAVIGAALVIGAGGTAASAGPFSTARSPGWRVVRYFGQCSSAGVLSVTATGPLDAWATGQAWRFQCDQPGLLITRWDGRTWQDLEPPARFAVAPGRQSVGHAVAALSSSYSWTFVNHVSFPHAAESFALLWRNGRWRTFRLHDGATLTSAVTFSRSNAWAFGGIANNGPFYFAPYAVHFNGKWWRHVVVPVLAFGTAAPSPRNIWAVGPTEFDRVPLTAFKLAHWNGKQWSAMALPFPQDPDLGEIIVRASVLSDGSRGAWVAEDLSNFGASGKLVNSGALLHWTGRIWQEVHLPFKTAGLGPLARDGHGGLWVASLRAPVCAVCDDLDMAHYRAGRWTLTRVHVQGATVTAMRLIPGTTSVWASASGVLSTDGQDDTTGAILKYGP